MSVSDVQPGRRGSRRGKTESEKIIRAEAYFSRLSKEGLSSGQLFARILQDPEAFEHAVLINKLHELIPELYTFEENLPDRDPNIYRPMPLMLHMFEAIRQSFAWMSQLGMEEYRSDTAKRQALLWVNTALLFHDLGEIAIIKGTNLPIWYHFTVEWTKKRRRNILRETYPFFGMDTPEGRSYINHLKHPEISASLAEEPLSRLGWDSRTIKLIQFLIRNHSVLVEQATYGRLKDGRILHKDLYRDITLVHEQSGVPKEDLMKMLQAVQMMDAKAIKPGMAQIPQETMMRVWMAYSYMNIVLTARNSDRRFTAFKNYRRTFSRVRKEMPFGTPFRELFEELLRRIEETDGGIDEEDRTLLEQELECFEIFETIREDHIHINNQFNQLLHQLERKRGKELSDTDRTILLQSYKMAYRSHDGQFRRAYKIIPTGDKRRKYIEHPIKVAKIMVRFFDVTDPLTLAAVMFHDVLEDTDIDIGDILAAFKNEDEKGRIISAITILTKPESRKVLQDKRHKDLAYLTYVAKILTAGDTVYGDHELLEWLRYILPRTKAADKIHNRRTLIARSPKGRIKEICRNWNTLVLFMESSNLTRAEKLKLLNEFDRSFFEIFRLLDYRDAENKKRLVDSLSVFGQFISGQSETADKWDATRQEAKEELEDTLNLLPGYLENPEALPEKLKELEKDLPFYCKRMGLDTRQTSAVIDEFTFFLFNVSEVHWISDEGKRKIIGFQAVVRRYKEKIEEKNWEPELAGILDSLIRYAQGYKDAPAPIIHIGGRPDLHELLLKVPAVPRRYVMSFERKKRKLVARLLPRIALLPVEQIFCLEGTEIEHSDRSMVEKDIGGLHVDTRSGRIVISIDQPIEQPDLRYI